jgi:hypothetical protein
LNRFTKNADDLRQTFKRLAFEWEVGKFNPYWNSVHIRGREIKVFWHCPENERTVID